MSTVPENNEQPVTAEQQPTYTTSTTKVVNRDNHFDHHHHDSWKWVYAGGATVITLLIFLVGFAIGLATGVNVHSHPHHPDRSYVHPLPAPYQPYLYNQDGGMAPGSGSQYYQERGGNSSGLSNGQDKSSSGESRVPSTGIPKTNTDQ